MKYDLTRLKAGIEKEIKVGNTHVFTKEELEGTEILSLEDLKVEGVITLDTLNEVSMELKAKGTMYLPCSVTLKPVAYPFQFEIRGNAEEILNEMEENPKKIENTLDIFPIIWENILMEIPMKVTSPDAHDISLEGDGWKLVTESDREDANLALEDLKDLL